MGEGRVGQVKGWTFHSTAGLKAQIRAESILCVPDTSPWANRYCKESEGLES